MACGRTLQGTSHCVGLINHLLHCMHAVHLKTGQRGGKLVFLANEVETGFAYQQCGKLVLLVNEVENWHCYMHVIHSGPRLFPSKFLPFGGKDFVCRNCRFLKFSCVYFVARPLNI